MRKLTKPEIDAAPGWATDFIRIGKDVRYQNNKIGIFLKASEGNVQCFRGDNYRKGEPIPRKEFDIKSYEFDDPILSVSESSKESIAFNCYTRESVAFTREDWIAGAKHFKLTASDLS